MLAADLYFCMLLHHQQLLMDIYTFIYDDCIIDFAAYCHIYIILLIPYMYMDIYAGTIYSETSLDAADA